MAKEQISFYDTILDLIDPEFIEIEGGYYIKKSYERTYEINKLSLTDRELLVNHHHIGDGYTFIEDETTGLPAKNAPWDDRYDEQEWRFGCAVIRAWATKLSQLFPGIRFRLYCYKFRDPEIGFYRLRENEPKRLENEGGAYIIDTGSES